uniref:metalloproteinase inhibitor 4-like isoform X2 n=1 Tax=Myxine glutinosa TaxID=7769 RepID=UPI00358F1E55
MVASCTQVHGTWLQIKMVRGLVCEKKLIYFNDTKDPWMRYNVTILKVFKGDIVTRTTRYFYSPFEEMVCGIALNLKTQYIITGMQDKDKLKINLCDFVKPWKDITNIQKYAFRKTYRRTCACKISHCSSLPCEPHHIGECAWSDWVKHRSPDGPEAKEKFCQRQRNGICSWVDVPKKARCPVNWSTERPPTKSVTDSARENASVTSTGASETVF